MFACLKLLVLLFCVSFLYLFLQSLIIQHYILENNAWMYDRTSLVTIHWLWNYKCERFIIADILSIRQFSFFWSKISRDIIEHGWPLPWQLYSHYRKKSQLILPLLSPPRRRARTKKKCIYIFQSWLLSVLVPVLLLGGCNIKLAMIFSSNDSTTFKA